MPIEYDPEPLSEPNPHYVSRKDEYVVIVSPEIDPREFCKPGYEILHELEIWRAGAFPADVILRPERDGLEVEIKPDLSPLLDQFQSMTRVPEDHWLEATFEDQISGWDA